MKVQARGLSLILAGLCLFTPYRAEAEKQRLGLAVQNGWYVHNGSVVWGYAQHNGWWRDGQRTSDVRRSGLKI